MPCVIDGNPGLRRAVGDLATRSSRGLQRWRHDGRSLRERAGFPDAGGVLMPSVIVAGRTVVYSVAGSTSGMPVMFVHGSFGGSSAWRRLISRLDQAQVRTITLDLPGWGSSDAPPDPVVHHQAAAVEAVMKVIGEPVHLIAHSHGGTVALMTAISARIPIRSLTLFEPLPLAVLVGRDDLIDQMRTFLKDYRTAWEAGDHLAVGRVIDLWAGPGTFQAMSTEAREVAAAGTALNIREWQSHFEVQIPLDSFRALSPPTTIVVTERGHRVARAMGESLHRLVARSTLIDMPGASHAMIHTHAADAAKIVGRGVGLQS